MGDPPGKEGTALMLARVLEAEAGRVLDPARSLLSARVDRTTTVFTLLTLPEGWPGVWQVVDSVIFMGQLDPGSLLGRRQELLERLRFEEGSPVREFERAAVELFADPGSPWARPVRGSMTSVQAIDVGTLSEYRSARYDRSAAALAVVGPLGTAEKTDAPPDTSAARPDSLADSPVPPNPEADSLAAATDTARAGEGEGLAPARAPPPRDVPWLTGDRINRIEDVTATWITVGYPVPPDLPRTHLELVAHLLIEELDPVPPDPDRYDIDVRIDRTSRGSMLRIQATVFPEAADRWERRILEAVERLGAAPIGEDFFRWRRRRFRTARLLEQSPPEAEADRVTADLLREGRARDLDLEIWGLTAAALQAAAASLGEPRIFRYGPDLGQEGQGGSGPQDRDVREPTGSH
jgi:predicted Zn-dependent peptidase